MSLKVLPKINFFQQTLLRISYIKMMDHSDQQSESSSRRKQIAKIKKTFY